MNNQSESSDQPIEGTIGKQLSFAGFLYDQGLKALDASILAKSSQDDNTWAARSQDMTEAYGAADSWSAISASILKRRFTWAAKQGLFG